MLKVCGATLLGQDFKNMFVHFVGMGDIQSTLVLKGKKGTYSKQGPFILVADLLPGGKGKWE